jgi:hypothetical protein
MTTADRADVRFDYDGSLELARRLWALADRLAVLAVDRRHGAGEALARWEGRYGRDFAVRIDTETADLDRIAADLRAVAEGWAQAWADALNLQNRRAHARAVDRARRDRSLLDQVGGFLFGHDDLPPEPFLRPPPPPPGFRPTGGFARY